MPDLKNAPREKKQIGPNDRLPPNSLEAEQGVIGCILLEPLVRLPEVVQEIGENEKVFYDLRHQQIFTIILELYAESVMIDLISLRERLKLWGVLEEVGNINYLAEIQNAVPSSANLDYYLEIVVEKYKLRQMLAACTEGVGRIYAEDGTQPKQVLDSIEAEVLKVNQERRRTSIRTMRELVVEAMDEIEREIREPGAIVGMRTGFPDLDRATGGLRNQQMYVLAGRPSTGKTSLAMNIADFVAIEGRIPVGVFSMEMSELMLTKRMICSRARVNIRSMADNFISESDSTRMVAAAGYISQAPIYIDDQGALSILEVRSRARRMVQLYGCKLFVVDYLQLMNNSGSRKKYESRQQEVSDISSSIKEIAKELNVPVIVLSQLNRELDREKNRKPRLSDLRESGSIEQDADLVGILYEQGREEDEPEPEPDAAIPVNLLIAKQRNGPRNFDIPLTFLRSYTRFESAARISDQDVASADQQELATR